MHFTTGGHHPNSMALLDILVYPDPRLRTRAEPVEHFGDALQCLIDDMAETMYAAPGIGLAATQVNVHQRLLVIDVSENQDALQVYINPVLIGSGELIESDEGCLSVPGAIVPVYRYPNIKVCALDREGQPFEKEVSGLLAICLQHEVDHLDGKVFVDYLSQLKRDRIRKRLIREQRPTDLRSASSKEASAVS